MKKIFSTWTTAVALAAASQLMVPSPAAAQEILAYTYTSDGAQLIIDTSTIQNTEDGYQVQVRELLGRGCREARTYLFTRKENSWYYKIKGATNPAHGFKAEKNRAVTAIINACLPYFH